MSDHCCLHCDGTVYKADTEIDTVVMEDECKTVQTLGIFLTKHPENIIINLKDRGEKRNQIVVMISLGLLGLRRGLDLGPVSIASKYFNTLGNNINLHIRDNFKNPFLPLILRSHPGGGTTFCLC